MFTQKGVEKRKPPVGVRKNLMKGAKHERKKTQIEVMIFDDS